MQVTDVSRVRLMAITVVSFSVAFVLVPCGSADGTGLEDPIIGVANATGPCSPTGLSDGGGTICASNTTAFSLTDLEDGTESLQAVVGTQTSPVYLVDNDTGSTSFSLVFNGLIAFNQFMTCQENGAFAGGSCKVSGALGTVGTNAQYGPPAGLVNGDYWNPDATFTFTGVGAGDFDITFASFGNGSSGTLTGAPVPTPESSSLLVLATDLFFVLGIVAFLRKQRRSKERAC
jgi:hypothetical protein